MTTEEQKLIAEHKWALEFVYTSLRLTFAKQLQSGKSAIEIIEDIKFSAERATAQTAQ